MKDPRVPTSLNVIAFLFLIQGILAAFETVERWKTGGWYINFGLLGFPIFFGLRSLKAQWRTCALVFTWLGFIVSAGMFVGGLFASDPVPFTFFGTRGFISPHWISIFSIPSFCLGLWMLKVLTRPDIRKLFIPFEAEEDSTTQLQPQPKPSEPGGECQQCGVTMKRGWPTCHCCGWAPPPAPNP